ncbi:hypothetical protein CVS30_08670 [Arthrobacter psychrolactophilus]|uniref:Uncharacterized protein n=1 Tax=Arthrobacter psychrolactophilus TaxID=92442 RepID=A0A2V5IPX6_9MICC|nr:hypothetical protein [Arthrobacter psychrolactophilus]PYI38629.1 hypothetical protein CVS30_08670 [Arthrobacter psychrolactophilus]
MAFDDDKQLRELRRVLPLAHLTVGELWLKYFAIGGSAGQFEVEAYLFAAHTLPVLERDLVAQALNEHFMDLGVDVRIPYSAAVDPGGETGSGELGG